MANRFTEFILKSPPLQISLPLVHTTDAFLFRDIIISGEIKPSPCAVFLGEDLLYLFYGRPAYKPNSEIDPTKLGTFFPICFILRENAIAFAKRVFPFDSGAFKEGYFNRYRHKKMDLGNFVVDPDSSGNVPIPDIPSRIVSSFYGSNKSYYFGAPTGFEQVDLPVLDFEVQTYCEIIQNKSITHYDDRCSAIEIQFNRSIRLSTDTLHAIIVPIDFFEDEEIRDRIIDNYGIELFPYYTYKASPSDYSLQIREVVRGFLQEKKFI